MKKQIAKVIWDLSENLHIPLGKYAPVIFGWMIGCKGKKTSPDINDIPVTFEEVKP